MYFLGYLGGHLKSDEVIEVLERADMEVIYAFDRSHENIPDAYWAAAHNHGFQFRFDEKQILDTIFLHIEPSEEFGSLDLEEECDVPFFSSFKEAQAHGSQSNWPVDTGKVDFLGVTREWIRFRFEEHTLHYEYRKGRLAMVTLSQVQGPRTMNRKRKCTAPTPKMPDNLVPHPRYGTTPRFTDLEFRGDRPGMNLGWKFARCIIIPGTGIEANTAKQHGSVMAIAIYFDVLKECIDCHRPFLFYAVEQKHWFEDLGFANDADCVRCVPCRKKEQKKERLNQEYQRLLTLKIRTPEERLQLACLALDMHSIGRLKSLQKIRTCFNSVPESEHYRAKYRELKARMRDMEKLRASQASTPPAP